jgi:hypothetical protein
MHLWVPAHPWLLLPLLQVVLSRKDGIYRFKGLEDSEMGGLYHVGFHWLMEGRTLIWKVRGGT